MNADWDAWQAALVTRVEDLASGRVTLDPATRRRAALVIVDDLAAMAAAVSEQQILRLASAAERIEPHAEARMVTGTRAGRAWAAMVNGVAANWNELDEGYRPATCHGGLYALPAAMAEVEARDGTVADLMTALVVGYEVATAYARAVPAPRPLALHPHATLSPVGAAAAVAAARGADGPGIAAAVQVAVTLAAVGPFEHATSGVLVRNGWAGHGAMSGFTAVELASAGVRSDDEAPRAVLERALGYPLDAAELSSTFERWAIHDGYHKSYACCQYAHSAVEAALSLVAGPLADVPAGEIVAVEVATHPLALPLDDASPTTVLGGKFSVPHSVAAVLVSRSVDTATFAGGLLGHPEVARLRQATTISAYPGELTPPFDRPARVTVTLADGAIVTAECRSAVGGPDRPMSDQDVLDKATLLTQTAMPGFAALAAQLVGDEIEGGTPWAALLEGMWSR